MTKRIVGIVIVAVIVALALYVVYLNSAHITVNFGKDSNITASAGLIYIVIFALGFFCALILAVAVALRSWWHEWRLESREKERQALYTTLLQARSAAAEENWKSARESWESILRRDPKNAIARIELSRVFEASGQPREALKVLEQARADDARNIEVLQRAVELNLALNNKTGALDNLALIMAHAPNLRAARLARGLAEDCGRLEDAQEYQRQVEKLGGRDETPDPNARIEYLKAKKEFEQSAKAAEDKAQYMENLRRLAKSSAVFPPALVELAGFEAQEGSIDKASQLLLRAAKATGETAYWEKAARLWLSPNSAEKALAIAKTAAQEAKGEQRLASEIALIKLYFSVNMIDQAKLCLDNFPKLQSQLGVNLSPELSKSLLILRALCASRRGDQSSCQAALEQML